MTQVGGATLFWVFEREHGDSFKTIPDSLYMVAIFLGGEWATADFTVPGALRAPSTADLAGDLGRRSWTLRSSIPRRDAQPNTPSGGAVGKSP